MIGFAIKDQHGGTHDVLGTEEAAKQALAKITPMEGLIFGIVPVQIRQIEIHPLLGIPVKIFEEIFP